MARPLKIIDWKIVDRLCAIQCTQEEIAAIQECTVDTLNTACKREKDLSFSEYFEEKRKVGRISLRRAQWQKAMGGAPALLIWLGKQYLNQSDKLEQKDTTDPKKPQRLIIDLSGKSFEVTLDEESETVKEVQNASDT